MRSPVAVRKGVKNKHESLRQRKQLPSKRVLQTEAHQIAARLLGNHPGVAVPAVRRVKGQSKAAAPPRAGAAQGVQPILRAAVVQEARPIRRVEIAPSGTHKVAVEVLRAVVMHKAVEEVLRAIVMRKAAAGVLRAVEAAVVRQDHVRVNQAATRVLAAMQRA